MKILLTVLLVSSLACLSTGQIYRCILETGCGQVNLRTIVEEARSNITTNVETHLENLVSNIMNTQSRISNAIEDSAFKTNFMEELSGSLENFQPGAEEFVTDLRMRLMTTSDSIEDSIRRYTNNISYAHFEMIVANLNDGGTFSDIINAVSDARQCFLTNLYDRGFMDTQNAVRGVITRSKETIDRVAALTKTVLVDLAPVIARIRYIRSRFDPHQSCLDILATNLACRLCQSPDREFPCYEFCDQTLSYCLSVVRGSLADVRDVVRVVRLISDALEGREVSERFNQTLLSFATLAMAVEDLGENVIRFILDFDIAEFIRDVANECFPGIVSIIRDVYDNFRNAVRAAVETIRAIIEEAINRIRNRIENTINFFRNIFSRRRRHIADNIKLLLLDEVLNLIVEEFCDSLPSSRGDQCWNGTAVGAYMPEFSVGFSVDSQIDNPAVISSETNLQQALSSVQGEVSALAAGNTEVCTSLTISVGNATLYNELSNMNDTCYSELNRSGLLASSLLFLLSMLIVYSLHLF